MPTSYADNYMYIHMPTSYTDDYMYMYDIYICANDMHNSAARTVDDVHTAVCCTK